MKVLLVRPIRTNQSLGAEVLLVFEPLAFEYLGAAIKDNHEVKVIDFRVDSSITLKEAIESFKPDIIGAGCCSSEVSSVKRTMAEVKKIRPEILTVVGGHHATVSPDELFQDYIDVVVSGQGVEPFKKICDSHEKKESFEEIENIYYRKNGKMSFTKNKPFQGWEGIPIPDRSITAQYRDKYLYPFSGDKKVQPFACVSNSVGCRFRCKFCAVTKMFNRQVFFRPMEEVIQELHSIKEPVIFWLDDEFLIDHKRSLLLAKEIAKAGIKKSHMISCRSDTVINHPECIEAWAKIGLKSAMIGLEAHSDKELKRMQKDSSIAKNEEAANICKANNVQIRGNFIVHPDYTKEDFSELATYARNLDIEVKGFTIMTPFPGTEFYEEVKDSLITKNLDLYDVYHAVVPTRLPLKQFYKEYSNLFMKATPMLKRIKILKNLDPTIRKKFIAAGKNLRKQLKNAYQDHLN